MGPTHNLSDELVGQLPGGYQPDYHKRYETAESAEDLYVEPEFSFRQDRRIGLQVSTSQIAHASRRGVIFKVYDVTGGQSDCSSEGGRLLLTQTTGPLGQYAGSLDLPDGAQRLLIEARIIGLKNTRCIDVSSAQGDIHSIEFGMPLSI